MVGEMRATHSKGLLGFNAASSAHSPANFAAILFSVIVTFLAPAFARTLLLCLTS
jgi:hypothetical protein